MGPVPSPGGTSSTLLTNAEIIALWIWEGGPIHQAPMALARALAESSGDPAVTSGNPDGGTNVGLYQLDTKGVGAGHSVSELQDPFTNTRITVQATNGGTDWAEWADNWPAFISEAQAEVSAFSSAAGGNLTAYVMRALAGLGGKHRPGPGDQTAAPEPGGGSIDVSAPLQAAGAFFHDISVPIAWALEVFEPGQGVRLVAGGAAIVAGAGGLKAWHAAAGNPEGTALPVAIALFGVAAAGAFIAIRPWPQPGGKPVKTWAYVASVVKGQPPAAGPAARPPVGAVEAGLVTLFGLWAASKAAEGIAGAVTAGAGVGAAFGKLWSKIKPIAEDVGKAGEIAGEAAA